MKSKAVTIEKWLNEHYEAANFGHAFGHNAEEPKRIQKSNKAFRVRNVAFGFNAEEIGRAERAKIYDTPIRLGFYPLLEWGWGRQECIDYIYEKTGIIWSKSACVYCPFAHNKANLVTLQARHIARPKQTAHVLMLERMSLALNPRGSLYRAETLMAMTQRAENSTALEQFHAMLTNSEWAIYRVRRLYGVKAGIDRGEAKKGAVQRAVEKMLTFPTEASALGKLKEWAANDWKEVEVENGIHYLHIERRAESYPAREEYFVVAPARVESKTRYGIDKFNAQWDPGQYAMEFSAA